MNRAVFLWAGALAVALAGLAGCVPVMVAGAVGGTAMVATDRRSAGAQVDDEAIELKLSSKIGTDYETRAHVNVTSFNGVVLITGEVPDQEALTFIGNLAKGTEKVRVVHNELVVGPNSDLSSRSNDTYITGKVKSRMIEANKFPPNAVKVVTERGVVYLMGLVSKEEGDAAAEIAATTSGVVRVVKFFQYPT
ncbi:MAG TPA: BON domain-containing protein [Casimicrobiaceae bacterium]|nr:BON domain-containing protein [Casimicrobiaceae bacterium]